MSLMRQRFGQNVCNLKLVGDVFRDDRPQGYLLTDIVIVNVNVLRAPMVNRISSKMNRGQIITEDSSRFRLRDPEISKQMTK